MNKEVFMIMMGNALFDDDHFTDQQKKHITKVIAKAIRQTEDIELSMLSHVIVDNIETRGDRAELFTEIGLNNEWELKKLIDKVKGLENEQNIEKK